MFRGLGLRVWGLRFRVEGLEVLWLGMQGSGSGLVWDVGFNV